MPIPPVPNESPEESAERHQRIQRVKRFLRHVPRKANLHRYPFIKWFAQSARKRAYMWSFRATEVIPALYAGWIVTLMPLYGCQIPLAFLLSILLRGNLMILVGLQLISNPLTIAPIYWADYQLGEHIFAFFDSDGTTAMSDSFNLETGADIPHAGKPYVRYVLATMVGGAIWGYLCGLINVIAYKISRKRWAQRHSKQKKKNPS